MSINSKNFDADPSMPQPLRLLLQYTNDIVILIDNNYKVVTLNQNAAELFGWDIDSKIGVNFLKTCLDDGIECCLPKNLEELLTKHEATSQTVVKLDDGFVTISWQIERLSVIPEYQDCVLLVGKDVTAQKVLGEHFRLPCTTNYSIPDEYCYYLEKISDAIPGIIFWKALDGIYLGCNDYFLKACELNDKSQVLNRTDYDLWPKEAEVLRAHDQKVIREGQTLKLEEHVTLNNGEILYNTIIKSPLFDASGQVIGVIGTGININDIKHSQSELLFNLESILESIPGAVYWKDANGVWLGCNQAVLDAAELNSKSDIVGKHDSELWPEAADNLRENDLEVMTTGQAMSFEERIYLPDGRTREFTVVKSPLKDQNGNIIGVIGNSLEITELKQIQAELERAKKMAEEASTAKTEFLRNMRHDLRTPFSGILGLTQILKLDEEDPSKLVILNDIISSANSLLYMVSEIMEHSQMESSHDVVVMKRFSLKTLSEELEASMSASIREKGLQLSVYYDPDLPQTLIGDKFKIQRILVNLLGNAIKFTSSGQISLSIVSGEVNNNTIYTLFIVKDTGIGIPEEKFNFIFERFSKVSSSYSDSRRGMGLGLHAVKELVDSLGGEIELESQVGLGSTFTCIIPMKKPLISNEAIAQAEEKVDRLEDIMSVKAAEIESGQAGNKVGKSLGESGVMPHVLLVEDDRIAQTVATNLLTRHNYTVSTASCGQEALDLLTQSSFDLVLLDVGLPDIDGIELLQKMRTELAISVPVIVLTAHLEPSKTEEVKDLDVDMVLSKPLTSEMVDKISKCYS